MATTTSLNGVDMVTRVPTDSLDKEAQHALADVLSKFLREKGRYIKMFEIEFLKEHDQVLLHCDGIINAGYPLKEVTTLFYLNEIKYVEPSKGATQIRVFLDLPIDLIADNPQLIKWLNKTGKMDLMMLRDYVDGMEIGFAPASRTIELREIKVLRRRLMAAIGEIPDAIAVEAANPDPKEFGIAFTLQVLDVSITHEHILVKLKEKEKGIGIELITPYPGRPSYQLLVYRWPGEAKPIIAKRLFSQALNGNGHSEAPVVVEELLRPFEPTDPVEEVDWVQTFFGDDDSTVPSEDSDESLSITTEELRMQERLVAMAGMLGIELEEVASADDRYFAAYRVSGDAKKIEEALGLFRVADIDFKEKSSSSEPLRILLRRQPRNSFGLLLPKLVDVLRQRVIILPRAYDCQAVKRAGKLQLNFTTLDREETEDLFFEAMSVAQLEADQSEEGVE